MPAAPHPDNDGPSADGQVAPRDEARRAGLLAHLVTYLGTDYVPVGERISRDLNLDLYVFAPSEQFPHVTLVTSGVSDLPMRTPAGYQWDRTEVLIAIPAGWPGIDPLDIDLLRDDANFWPIRLLKDVARIPGSNDTFLAWGQTVSYADGALFPPGSAYVGALLGPPLGYPPSLMTAPSDAGPTQILAVFPLTGPELDYAVSLPSGGASLVDRLIEGGGTAVVARDRGPIVSGPPPYAAAVLLREQADGLGQAVAHATPNWAEQLRDERLDEAVFDPDGQAVRLRATGPVAADVLLGRTRADLVSQEARAAVHEHRGQVWVLPETSGDGDQVTRVFSWSSLLTEHPDALAVWLPHQRRVLTSAEFTSAVDREPVVLAAVHATEGPDGKQAVTTSGLAGLGSRELWFFDDGMPVSAMIKRVTAALERADDDEPDVAPKAGRYVRYGTSWYQLVDGVDPVTDSPVLVLTEAQNPKKAGLDRNGAPLPDSPARRGLFRRRG